MKRDLRSPLAKARDEWLASEEGRPVAVPYLQNRLTMAFLCRGAVGDETTQRKCLTNLNA